MPIVIAHGVEDGADEGDGGHGSGAGCAGEGMLYAFESVIKHTNRQDHNQAKKSPSHTKRSIRIRIQWYRFHPFYSQAFMCEH